MVKYICAPLVNLAIRKNSDEEVYSPDSSGDDCSEEDDSGIGTTDFEDGELYDKEVHINEIGIGGVIKVKKSSPLVHRSNKGHGEACNRKKVGTISLKEPSVLLGEFVSNNVTRTD